MTNSYKPANKFSRFCTLAQAAVEWQGLLREQQDLVVIEDGIPFLAGVPDLGDRAEALAEAAYHDEIAGYTHTEDGYPLRAENVQLERASVAAWIAKNHASEPLPIVPGAQEVMLTQAQVLDILNISRSTLVRRIESGAIARAHLDAPQRWRKSYIDSLLVGTNCE